MLPWEKHPSRSNIPHMSNVWPWLLFIVIANAYIYKVNKIELKNFSFLYITYQTKRKLYAGYFDRHFPLVWRENHSVEAVLLPSMQTKQYHTPDGFLIASHHLESSTIAETICNRIILEQNDRWPYFNIQLVFREAFGCGCMGILDWIDVLLVIVRSFYRVCAQVHIVLTL